MESNEKFGQPSNDSLTGLVRTYCEGTLAALKKEEAEERNRQEWNHLNHLMDVVRLDQLMTKDFDFKHYYC